MKKSWLILLVIAILLTACTPKAPTGTTYIDGEGRSIVLAGPAQRIVSLAPSNTEILYAIGAGDQVVGRDEFSDYPAEAKDLPSVAARWVNMTLRRSPLWNPTWCWQPPLTPPNR